MANARKERISHARVLVELGELFDAEIEIAQVIEEEPNNLDALSLLGKIKHMRGELSQAVVCWAQLRSKAPLENKVRMQLDAILHLAMSPDRGAGEFLALGHLRLVRKPVVHIELEGAFAAFVARDPERARAKCVEIANKYHGKDLETYKLAVLANAYVAELSGLVDDACRVLELLGRERGFEADNDRVLALAGLYERSGTRERLESAANIYRTLYGRFGALSLLGRLAHVHRRLGQSDAEAEYGRRYLDAFRLRHHRPTLVEIAEVAASRYIPLDRLACVRRQPSDVHADLLPRARGVVHALEGRYGNAFESFEHGGEILDQKYLADLAAMSGRAEEALGKYLDIARACADDVRIVKRLLDRLAETRTPAIAEALRQPKLFREARRTLEEAIRVVPQRPSLWRCLATLLELDPGLANDASRARERATALYEAAQRDRNPIGRVLAAATLHLLGKRKGIVHEVWAGRDVAERGRGGALPVDHVFGNVGSEMRRGVQNTFLSVREWSRSKFPHFTLDILDYNYTYKVTKEDEPSSGSSVGLPTAVAFLSVFLQRPVPQDLALTGEIVADSHDVLVVRAIGDAESKVEAAVHRNLRGVLLPLGNRMELEESARVPPTIRDEIVRYVANFDDAVRDIFGEDVFVAGLPASAER